MISFIAEHQEWIIMSSLALLFLYLTILFVRRNREKREEYHLEQEIELSDRLFKPAELSNKYIYAPLEDAVKKYLEAFYSNKPEMLPAALTDGVRNEIIYDMNRKQSLGVRNQLQSLEIIGKMRIHQDNSSIYAVRYITVTANYEVDYNTEHDTYRKRIQKKVRREFVFEVENEGGFAIYKVNPEIVQEIQEENY